MIGTPLRRRTSAIAAMIAAPRRLLEQGDVQLLQVRPPPDRLIDRVAAVRIDRQQDVRADGVAHRPQSLHVDARMLVAADLHLDRRPAALDHALRPLGRQLRLDGADHEFEANAAFALTPASAAAEQLVDRHAERLALQVEQGHLQRRPWRNCCRTRPDPDGG